MSGAWAGGGCPAAARRKPVLIAACGNDMAGDDAFGPLVAAILRRRPLPGAEVLDLGSNPAALLDHLEGRRALLVADAAAGAGLPPGQLLDLDWREARGLLLPPTASISSHAPSVAQQLALAETLGDMPPFVRLIVLVAGEAKCRSMPRPLLLRRAILASAQIRRHAASHLSRSGR